MREFETGATRDTNEGKLDYEAFLHPDVLESYAKYMHKHRIQSDGTMREGDNWQKGMPKSVYMKSLWRHFHTLWKHHRQGDVTEDMLNSVLFNTMGYLKEHLDD